MAMTALQASKRIDNLLREFTDGCLLVAFSTDGMPIIIAQFNNTKTAISLNAILGGILSSGGVECVKKKVQGDAPAE